MLESIFEAVAGIAFGLAEVVHQFALYAFLTVAGGIMISIPIMVAAAGYIAFKVLTEKPDRSAP